MGTQSARMPDLEPSLPPHLEDEPWPQIERRLGPDRGARATTFWQAVTGKGRRRSGRRDGERENIYVEIYGRREVILVVFILVLNILDALLTLDYLEKGGWEANPVARGLLDLGDAWFLGAKTCLIGICLLFLLVHQTFKYVRAALYALTTFYSLLFLYHLFLQARFHETL
jgi:Domain of unknown function (DUF5658)